MLKQYSRALDMLIAAAAAQQKGQTKLAAKLLVKAAEQKGINEILATLDGWNSKAAEDNKWKTMAKALVQASSAKASKKAVEKAADDMGDDLGLEDLDLEEGDLDEGVGDDADIDEILDGLDGGEVAAEGEEEKKDDGEEAGEHNDVSKSPDEPEHLNEEKPAPDRNEAAKVQAKVGTKRVEAVAHNLKALARLLKA